MRHFSVVVVLLVLAGCATSAPQSGYQPARPAYQFQPYYLQMPEQPRAPVSTTCQPSYNGSVACRSY